MSSSLQFSSGIQQQKGFTLLELIIVIVLLGIMSVSLGRLTSHTVFSYIDGKDRNRLSQSGKWMMERLSREIREALPQSVRTGSGSGFHCVEFMPIENSSTYFDLPATGNVSSFTAAEYDLVASISSLVAIMPINPTSLYSGTGTLGTLSSVTATADPDQVLITLTSPTNFSRRSPQSRFFLLSGPVSFCLNNANGQMLRHSGYGISTSQSFPPSGGSLIGQDFTADTTVFNYQPDTLSRSGLLQINLRAQNRGRSLSANQEAFDIFHEVHVRNVP